MSQRDQPNSGQRSGSGGRGGSTPSNRSNDFGDDSFELPAWSDAPANNRPSGRASRAGQPPAGETRRVEDASRRSRPADDLPSLGDALSRRESRQRKGNEEPELAREDRMPVDDSYDRLRVQSARQRRSAPFDEFEQDDRPEPVEAVTDHRRYPSEAPMRRPRRAAARQIKAPNMGAAVTFANQFERPKLAIASIGVVSLVLMVATVAARQSRLTDWMPIHLNAAGVPDQWGSPSTLWRLPLMAAMVSLMAIVLAWFAAKRDAFAAQFVLASTLLIQALCWIALIHLAW